MNPASSRRIRPKHFVVALALLALASGGPGCGSPAGGLPGSAKEKKEEDRYRYEGKGRAKQKVLVRRKDERLKERPGPDKAPD